MADVAPGQGATDSSSPSRSSRFPVQGAGLGLRRSMLAGLRAFEGPLTVNFWEVAPENWINVGGPMGRQFRAMTERYSFVTHGLSLSLGGPDPLDETFLRKVRRFLDLHQIRCYTEHLSYCTDGGHLYDLMPIPFTEEAIDHVVSRIERTQEIVGRRIAIENVSYYAAPGREMDEIEFVNAVLERADCQLLLDVNNIYVNSVNHGYDAHEYLAALPGDRVAYCHVAGHYEEAEDLIVDTHGAPVIDPVWALLDRAYELFGPLPTLVERDFNLPPIAELLEEVDQVRAIQARHAVSSKPANAVA